MNWQLSLFGGRRAAIGRYSNALWGVLSVMAGILLLLGFRLGWIDVLPRAQERSEESSASSVSATEVVQLTPEKLAAAELRLATAETQAVQRTRAVPGSITYDASQHLPVNAPVACVVLKVLVEPGQQVSASQPLAVLSSREIGEARNEVLKREADLAIARREETRCEQVAANVGELLTLLAQKPKLPQVEVALDKRSLGEYREKIIGAYSKLLLAELVVEETAGLESGTLSRRLVEERKSAREVASAQYAAACDTARFAAVQERDRARAQTEQAERLLAVAQQALKNLLGPQADMTPVSDRERLSELVVLAPLTGRIEERQAVQAARIATGGSLFTIANTRTMWVAAEIHERDWPALQLAQKQGEVVVRVPALDGVEMAAKVHHVGAQVAADTRSVPLVAEVSNSEGRLKPGMFVWVEVPLESPRRALVIPASAIMRHENRAFVFVPAGDRTFRRVDVELGLESGGRIEVTAGLGQGDSIVDRGSFYLKSELLLEREE
jgi:cobalt-zinc-cadmium efflux system membrane fusion protein